MQDEYVRGNVHTANIDSFWSLLKRGIVGSFHKVSKSYLPLYLADFSYRHNHSHDSDVFDRVLEACRERRLKRNGNATGARRPRSQTQRGARSLTVRRCLIGCSVDYWRFRPTRKSKGGGKRGAVPRRR